MFSSPLFLRICALALCIPTSAQAGAWLQPEGRGQWILTSRYYTSDSFYNTQGHRQPQNTYHQYELNPYLEYGFSKHLTLGANLSLLAAKQHVTGLGHQRNLDLGDSEWFARLLLWKSDRAVLSAMPLLKLPSPHLSTRALPRIGSSHPDVGFGLSAGYSFDAWGKQHFADLGAVYRYRLGDPRDQWQLSATLGLSVGDRWRVMPQWFATRRMRHAGTPVTFTQSAGDDYDLTKAQLSVVYALDRATSVQLGTSRDLSGKNAGKGSSVFLALWRNF